MQPVVVVYSVRGTYNTIHGKGQSCPCLMFTHMGDVLLNLAPMRYRHALQQTVG